MGGGANPKDYPPPPPVPVNMLTPLYTAMIVRDLTTVQSAKGWIVYSGPRTARVPAAAHSAPRSLTCVHIAIHVGGVGCKAHTVNSPFCEYRLDVTLYSTPPAIYPPTPTQGLCLVEGPGNADGAPGVPIAQQHVLRPAFMPQESLGQS